MLCSGYGSPSEDFELSQAPVVKTVTGNEPEQVCTVTEICMLLQSGRFGSLQHSPNGSCSCTLPERVRSSCAFLREFFCVSRQFFAMSCRTVCLMCSLRTPDIDQPYRFYPGLDLSKTHIFSLRHPRACDHLICWDQNMSVIAQIHLTQGATPADMYVSWATGAAGGCGQSLTQ